MSKARTITRLQDADDVQAGIGSGQGFIFNGSLFIPTDLATQAELDTHAALTTTAHGGIVASTDSRLTDSRPPSGAAGGALAGNFPNPTLAPGATTPQAALTGRGLLAETFPVALCDSNIAPTSQTVYYGLLGLVAGQSVVGVSVCVGVVAVGAVPTAIYVALFSTAGTRLAVSNDLKASAIWTTATGPVPAPFSGAYVVPTSGAYYVAFLINGVFGGTNLQLRRFGAGSDTIKALSGGSALYGTQTGQATMPTPTATITVNTPALWMGAY